MLKNFKNHFSHIIVLIGISTICACGHISNFFTSDKTSSYYNDEVISKDKFSAIKKIMNDNVKKYQAKNGTFILLDASDSTIVATYTTNNSSAIDKELYEAGAVFKTFDIAMGLESGKIKDSDKIDTSEPFIVDDIKITDTQSSATSLTPEQILVKSSNIGAAKIASKVGGEYQYNFFDKLGLLTKFDSYGINSAKPLFSPKENWIKDKKYITTLSFGHGISETPLHIITAYSAIINGGTYHKPSFEQIADKEGIYIISAANSERMRKYLRKVVTDGTARMANSDKYVLIGKAGTATKVGVGGKYQRDKTINTFVGNFEHNNTNYAILVMLDEPKGSQGTFGLQSAGWNVVPTAKKIIEELVK